MEKPKIAIVESNSLAAIGMKKLLEEVMPVMKAYSFNTFAELEANHPEQFVHYFVSTSILLENREFFQKNKNRTIVLTTANNMKAQLPDFNCLPVNVPEEVLIRSLLMLEQKGHAHGKNLPKMDEEDSDDKKKKLSVREIDVLTLMAQGLINKEIAEKLNIGLTTVITHRKNIQDKLGIKSLGALTIYAVMHGYVDINKI